MQEKERMDAIFSAQEELVGLICAMTDNEWSAACRMASFSLLAVDRIEEDCEPFFNANRSLPGIKFARRRFLAARDSWRGAEAANRPSEKS